MGVGYPEDLLVCVALGADMFDCVWPTRTAVGLAFSAFKADMRQRFGNAVTSLGVLNLRHASYRENFEPIDLECRCQCCLSVEDGGLGITKAFVHHVANKETAGAHLYVEDLSTLPLANHDQADDAQCSLSTCLDGVDSNCNYRGQISSFYQELL